jgi:hypothetical protein
LAKVSIVDALLPAQGATVFVCLSFFLLISFAVLTSYILFQHYFLLLLPSVADVIGIARRVDELELTDLLDPTKKKFFAAIPHQHNSRMLSLSKTRY